MGAGGELPQTGFRYVILGVAQAVLNSKIIVQNNARIAASTAAVGASSNAAAVSRLNFAFAGLGNTVKTLPKDFSKAAFFLGRLQFVVISTVAALAGLGAPVIFAGQFQKTLSLISGLTNATREDVGLLRKSIIDLSKVTAISPDELGTSAYFILSSGIDDVNTALKVLEFSARASLAGLGDTQNIARTTTAILNAYGLVAEDAGRITNILVGIINEGSAEPEELAQSIGRVIPLAAQMGVEFSQVGAVLATMTNVGISTERSITGLVGILSQLLRPTDRSRELFEALGFEVEAFRREVDDNFVGAMNRLFAALEGNDAIVAELFPDIRGLIGALAAFGRQGAETENIANRLASGFRFLDIAVVEAENTVAFKFRNALNSVRIGLIQLGTTALPAAGRFFDGITRLIRKTTIAAGRFRDEFGDTFVRLGENLQTFARDVGTIIQTINRVLTATGAILILRALGAILKVVAKNADIVIPAMLGFGAVMLANTILSSNFVIGLKLMTISLIEAGAAFTAAAVQGRLLAATLALISANPIIAVATAVGFLVGSRFILKRFSSSTDEAAKSLSELVSVSQKARQEAFFAGLTPEQTEFLAATKQVTFLLAELEKQERLVTREQERFTQSLRLGKLGLQDLTEHDFRETVKNIGLSRKSVDGLNEDLTAIKDLLSEDFAEKLELAQVLEEAGASAESLLFLFPEIVSAAEDLGFSGPAAIQQYTDSIQPAVDRTKELDDVITDVADSFDTLRSTIDKILGTRSAEIAALDLQIDSLRLTILKNKELALSQGGIDDATRDTNDQLRHNIDLLQARRDIITTSNDVLAGFIEVEHGALLSTEDLTKAAIALVPAIEQETIVIDALTEAAGLLRAKGFEPTAKVFEEMAQKLREKIVLDIDFEQVQDAEEATKKTLDAWNELGRRGGQPIELPVNLKLGISVGNLVSSVFGKIRDVISQIEEEAFQRPFDPTLGKTEKRENPFEEFINAEQARDLLLDIGRTGEVTWREVGRLWQLGFEDAADDFAAFMRGELTDLGAILEESFQQAGDAGMGALIRQILDGTVTTLDALGLLEAGMVGAAQQIIDALTGVAIATEERLDIIKEIVENGAASIQQVGRFLELGFIEEAIDLLRFMEGESSEIFGSILGFRRRFSRGGRFPESFQQGGFIPAGPPVPALLHGPEAVIPLGDMMALRGLQRALSGTGGGTNEGFRNFGRMDVHFGSDADMAVTRAIRKSLGA